MIGSEYVVNDASGVINIQPFLKRIAPKKYLSDKNGFLLLNDRDSLLASIRVKNGSMRQRTEDKVREFLGITDAPKGNIVRSTAVAVAAKPDPTRFIVALSCYDNAIAIFLPAALAGYRFSCIFVDGKLLFSQDNSGVEAKESTLERCVCQFSIKEWFPGNKFPLFNQYKVEVVADKNSFEIPLLFSQLPQKQIAPPEPIVTSSVVTDKEPESDRDRAIRYVRWLNEFSSRHDYTIKSEGNKLVLERNDRIA